MQKIKNKYILYAIAIFIVITVSFYVYDEMIEQEEGDQIDSAESENDDDNETIESYNPAIDPANFVTKIDNPYYTLTPGTSYTYSSKIGPNTEKNTVVVTNETKEILGIKTTVIWDRVWLNDKLIEETYDWYAQDKDGNVWYLGEDSKEYKDGKVVTSKGSWEAGVNGAKPGIIMKANPQPGDSYRQEYYKGEAEDMADVVSLDESAAVPYGVYENCLKTRDWSQIEKSLNEYKYYCKGAGNLVLETALDGSQRVELIDIE